MNEGVTGRYFRRDEREDSIPYRIVNVRRGAIAKGVSATIQVTSGKQEVIDLWDIINDLEVYLEQK